MNLNLVSTIQNGQFKRIDSDWKVGARLEGGYHLPLDDWIIYAKWTGLSGEMSGSTHINSVDTKNIAPIWLGAGYHFSGYERVLNAKGKWHLNYNVVDLGLMKRSFSSARLILGAHAGLQGAWINQQFLATYSGGTLAFSPTYFKGKNHFQAVGLFSAFDMAWCLARQWKILSRFQGSINFGRYNLSQQIRAEINDDFVVFPNDLRGVLHQIEYGMDLPTRRDLALNTSGSEKTV